MHRTLVNDRGCPGGRREERSEGLFSKIQLITKEKYHKIHGRMVGLLIWIRKDTSFRGEMTLRDKMSINNFFSAGQLVS